MGTQVNKIGVRPYILHSPLIKASINFILLNVRPGTKSLLL